MVLGVVNEMRTQREPLFPKSMFHSLAVGKAFIHGLRNTSRTTDVTALIRRHHFDHQLPPQLCIQRWDVLSGTVLPSTASILSPHSDSEWTDDGF